MADRLRVNQLVFNVTSWVASAIARRVELWDDNLVMQTLFARAAVLAFGDELLDLKLEKEDTFFDPGSPIEDDLMDPELPNEADSKWLSQGGREMAAAYLLPRAEAALRQELQRLADAVKRARAGHSSTSSSSRAQ